ncbi:hypothetical protein LCGC14_1720770 [marine sediment metagenome]|uniref:Uncharacterized protein n=1 Tax=marine sediment metagenome TaxID=412755 RepID=A0A0F9HC84_9ZZZZ
MPQYGNVTPTERQDVADSALREIIRVSTQASVVVHCERMLVIRSNKRNNAYMFRRISTMVKPGTLAHSLAMDGKEYDQNVVPEPVYELRIMRPFSLT